MSEQSTERAESEGSEKAAAEGYGDMTKAWFNASDEVADFEAGRAAERRRLVFAVVGVTVILGGVVAAIVLLS